MLSLFKKINARRKRVPWCVLEKALSSYGDQFFEELAFLMYKSVYPGIFKFSRYKSAEDLKNEEGRDFERWIRAAKELHGSYQELIQKEENL